VIAPFGLRHIQLLRQLQGACAQLDPNGALEEPASALRLALRGYFLGPRTGVQTYILRSSDHAQSQCGFAQTRAQAPQIPLVKTSLPAWRVVAMAPLLDASEDAATIWYRLLLHLCIAAGERGVTRLFACLPERSAAEDVFRQATFVTYSHQQTYWRENSEGLGHPSSAARQAVAEDALNVLRLWHKVTPRTVQQAEEPGNSRAATGSSEVATTNAERHYVLYSTTQQLQGLLSVSTGPRGVRLRLIVDSDARGAAARVLDHGLAAIEDHSRPVFCTVREYQGGLRALLEDRGFAPGETCSLLVKHTTVRVREPLRKLVPALEQGVEVTPSVSHSEPAEG